MRKAGNRLRVVVILCGIALLVVLGRIMYLTFQGSSRGAAGRKTIVRGPIVDRRGMTLALTEEASRIAANPGEIIDSDFTARHLSRFLETSPLFIREKLERNRKRRYIRLKRQVDNYVADQIMELRLPGIHREREYKRVYPGRKLAANLIGFTGRDQSRSLAGLERVYHQLLSSPETAGSRRGPRLHLTIDSIMQHRLEKHLGEAFGESRAKRATGIIMNVETGEILAMATFPNYDPNEYYRTRPEQRANWALRFNYEPGSTVKIFMAAALLEKQRVSMREKFLCEGSITFGDITIHCKYRGKIRRHGRLNLAQILEKSCNVGTIEAMRRINKDELHHFMTGLGFGRKANLLPGGAGERAGYFPGLNIWVPSTGYYVPIGQSFSVTPLQLMRAGASIANGGRLVQPYIAERISTTGGRTLSRNKPGSQPNPFSAETNRRVLHLMRGVVENGTARAAQVRGITSAGKTGTGQKATARGYVERYVASFMGFFPAVKPRYGMLIVFDEPTGHASGGSLAAPVYSRVLKDILPTIKEGVQAVNVAELKPAAPLKVNEQKLQDLRGFSAREATNIVVGSHHLPLRLQGSGRVFRQSPPPGTKLKDVETVELFLNDE